MLNKHCVIIRSSLVFTLLNIIFSTQIFAQDARQIAKQSFPSVVLLEMYDANKNLISQGSGFFVRSDVITTNYHVIANATYGFAKIVGENSKYNIAGVVGIDVERDLVLLKITGANAKSLVLADISQVEVGEEVYALGNPKGLEGTISLGIISGISLRQVKNENLIQITAAISSGSSGGPILNKKGEVVGIAVASPKDGQNLNFAVPSSYLALLLASMKPLISLGNVSSETKKGQDNTAIPSDTEPDICRDTPFPYKTYNSPRDYLDIGNYLMDAQKYAEAKEAFKRSIRLDSTYHQGYASLWRAYSTLGCDKKAMLAIRQAVILKPKETMYRQRLGIELIVSEKNNEAVEVYLEGIRLQPKEVEYYVGLGSAYFGLKKLSEAKEVYQKVIRLDSKNAESHFSLGLIYILLNDKENAVQELKILNTLDAEKADDLEKNINQAFPKR